MTILTTLSRTAILRTPVASGRFVGATVSSINRIAWTPSMAVVSVKAYSGPSVDYDHFTHGWAVADITDFTKPGKYGMKTFNKISPKVKRKCVSC